MKTEKKPGRVPIGIRVYNNKGTFIEKFESMSAFRKQYFSEDKGKRPIFNRKRTIFSNYKGKEITLKYGVINNEYYVFTETVYRDDVRHLHAVENSPFCLNNTSSDKIIEIYNINNEKIGEVISQNILTKLLPNVYPSKISTQLSSSGLKVKRTPGLGEELIFKYKKDEN
jgi:hypothetical protein